LSSVQFFRGIPQCFSHQKQTKKHQKIVQIKKIVQTKKHQKIVARPFSPVLSYSKIGHPSCFRPSFYTGGVEHRKNRKSQNFRFRLKSLSDSRCFGVVVRFPGLSGDFSSFSGFALETGATDIIGFPASSRAMIGP